MVKYAVRAVAAVGVVTTLVGCSSLGIDLGSEKVKYETSNSRAPLEVPPDLSAIDHSDRYSVPTRPQIVSANAEAAKLQLAAQQRGDSPVDVLPVTQMATVENDGTTRFVHVKAAPDKVWPLLQDFWAKVGLAVKQQNAKTGTIQTEWAENKANLPHDIIRKTVGTLLDVVYDTGTRDQYRARMERTDNDETNIYVTHRQMVEVLKGRQEDSTIWQPGPSDPELEAVMLTRLAQELELEFNPQAKPVEQQQLDAMAAVKYTPKSEIESDAQGVAQAVRIDEPFDRAWRRVGVALDRAGFEVTDTDRSRGLFMVRYLDPDYEKQKISEQGFFSNLFGSTKAVEPVDYQIRLMPDGEQTRVNVLGQDGRADQTGVAPRIVTLIGEQTR